MLARYRSVLSHTRLRSGVRDRADRPAAAGHVLAGDPPAGARRDPFLSGGRHRRRGVRVRHRGRLAAVRAVWSIGTAGRACSSPQRSARPPCSGRSSLAAAAGAGATVLVVLAAGSGSLAPAIAPSVRALLGEVTGEREARETAYALESVIQELIWVTRSARGRGRGGVRLRRRERCCSVLRSASSARSCSCARPWPSAGHRPSTTSNSRPPSRAASCASCSRPWC